ncbi:MAG TPA: CehA/McbA family metallohydrolase, partial [Fimbriimonas sp.]|nr:CehA/McbA family metallohydrolase [Fimbriimonas sp.]
FVTQASSEFPFEDHLKLSTPDFILRRSLEDRQGQFAGHLNSPGVELPDADRKATMHAAMPASATTEWVHAHGDAIIHTHTMVPPHQLHWMGAAEAYSYSIAGACPDAMDLDGEASENLWFMVLNLGNKVSCSGSTDAALERASSPAPGARRVYVHADHFDYDSIVKGIRAGKTFATNAGPLFAYVSMDGRGVAETVLPGDHRLKLEIDSLYPLTKAELIHNGAVESSYEVKGLSGTTGVDALFRDDTDGWYVCRIQDSEGNWAVTSPIYVRAAKQQSKPFAASTIFEIGNFSRLSTLNPNFMAHFIVTVSPTDPLTKVELLHDSAVLKEFSPSDGDQIADGKTPVTETFGNYKPDWLWHPSPRAAFRFQSDWDVKESGWYQVRATTKSGRVVNSDEIHYDASNPKSNETSAANLESVGIDVHHWGYGESLPLANLDPNADGWWYPDNTFFQMRCRFGSWDRTVGSEGQARMSSTFRATGGIRDSG